MKCPYCLGKGALPIKEMVDGNLVPVGSHPCVCQPGSATVMDFDDPTDRKPVWDAMSN